MNNAELFQKTADTFHDIMKTILDHNKENTALLITVLDQKDKIIAQKDQALDELKLHTKALSDNLDEMMENFDGDTSEAEENDTGEEFQPVSASTPKQIISIEYPNKTAANVALELHDKIKALRHVIHVSQDDGASPAQILEVVKRTLEQ